MRVATVVRFDQEVMVDISIEEVFEAIARLPESEREGAVLAAINSAYAALRRVPDSAIEGLSAAHRKIIEDGLRAQAERYVRTSETLT